jgi:hypothetical protein
MRFTVRERAKIAEVRRIQRAAREQAKTARPAQVAPTASGQRRPRAPDPGYLTWLHEGLPCIACLIEGGPRCGFGANPIEAAHQKHTDLRGASLGRRPSDATCCPLCAWHHRLAPDACDPAQRKFWDRLEVDVGDFCRALYCAYQGSQDGAAIVSGFARTP